MKKKFNKKKLLMFGLPILALALVSALTYYAFFNVQVTVDQPITVTGNLDQVVSTCESGETCVGQMVRVDNSANEARTVKIEKIWGDEDIAVSYVGKLRLSKKNVVFGTSPWSKVSGTDIFVEYTVVGNEFSAKVVGGEILEYELIYYKDNSDRFDNPALAIELNAITGSLPYAEDGNVDEYNYCGATFIPKDDDGLTVTGDNYEHCYGAKLWYVPSEAVDTSGNIDWGKASEFYYETDLIYYFDNAEGEITVPAKSFIEFYPAFTPDKYITGGAYDFRFEVQ